MGTDIHGVVQVRYGDDVKWKDEMVIEDSRNYFVFAVLGGVRNGAGFAGVPIFEPVTPIQENRGLPADFLMREDMHVEQGYNGKPEAHFRVKRDGEETTVFSISEYGEVLRETWMGDHSHGWITLAEWFNWPGWGRAFTHIGIVSRKVYHEWVRQAQRHRQAPSEYCGGISGPGVIVWDSGYEPQGWTHKRVNWQEPTIESVDVYKEFFQYLDAKYGEWPGRDNVRLVFGFDS